jgi:hypothetical protein
MIGFEWTVAKFLWYLFFMYFTLLYFTFYGMMAVGLTPNETIAVITSSAFYNVWNLFSGYLIPRPVSNSPLGLVNFTLTIAYGPQHFTGFLLHMTMSSNLLPLFFSSSETACLVEVVQLDLPSRMDTLRIGCLPIRRHHASAGGLTDRPDGGAVHHGLLRLPSRLPVGCRRGARRADRALRVPVQFCHHEVQLPE